MNMKGTKRARWNSHQFLTHDGEVLGHFHPGHLAFRCPGIAHFQRAGHENLGRIELHDPSVLPPARVANQPLLVQGHQFDLRQAIFAPRFKFEELFAIESLPAHADGQHRLDGRARRRSPQFLRGIVSPSRALSRGQLLRASNDPRQNEQSGQTEFFHERKLFTNCVGLANPESAEEGWSGVYTARFPFVIYPFSIGKVQLDRWPRTFRFAWNEPLQGGRLEPIWH